MSRQNFSLSYEISPIILIGGIAKNLPQQSMPIISLTEQRNFDGGMVQGNIPINENEYFAKFKILPGGKLISNVVGQYPFANQQVAANAIIAMPINISILMMCPANNINSYATKGQIISSLKKSLDQHNAAGGVYTIATPAYTYTNCLMTDFVDVSGGESKQVQYEYRIDFIRPLITIEQAQLAYNSLMGKLNNQLLVKPDSTGNIQWSGQQLTSDQISGTTLSTTGNQNVNPALINQNTQNNVTP